MFLRQLKPGDWITQVSYSRALQVSKDRLESLYGPSLKEFAEDNYNGSVDVALAAEASYYNCGFGAAKWEVEDLKEMVSGKCWVFLKNPIRLLTPTYEGPRIKELSFLVSCPYCEGCPEEASQNICEHGDCMQRLLEKAQK